MELLQSMLSHWQGALAVVLVLGGLIFFHELGHFSMARVFGIGVRTFSLGFGPRLWSRRVGKTDYCLSLIPLGGYVSLVGEGGEEESEDVPADDERVFSEQETFFVRPPWQRMLVIAAGPVANFVLAWLLCWGLAWAQGAATRVAEVGGVLPDSAALAAGLEPGDRILSINGVDVSSWGELSQAVQASEGSPLRTVILRKQEERSVELVPRASQYTTVFGEQKTGWQIGVSASGELVYTPLGFFAAAGAGWDRAWGMIVFTVEGIAKLFQRVVPLDAVGGPILIAQVVGQQAQEGLSAVLVLAALISVNLGLLNLLPIPVLDGGHLVFLTVEMLLRRPVNVALREISTRIGVVLLIGLMVFATWNDIVRLLS